MRVTDRTVDRLFERRLNRLDVHAFVRGFWLEVLVEPVVLSQQDTTLGDVVHEHRAGIKQGDSLGKCAAAENRASGEVISDSGKIQLRGHRRRTDQRRKI